MRKPRPPPNKAAQTLATKRQHVVKPRKGTRSYTRKGRRRAPLSVGVQSP